MRRLYLLLAAALIVLSLVALTMGSVGAVTEKYMAIATAPSDLGGSSSYGHTKAEAKRNAMTKCKRHNANDPDFRNDSTGPCGSTTASVAYEKRKEHPYKNLAWGSGWGPTKAEANHRGAEGLPSLRQGEVHHAVLRPFAKAGLGRDQGRPLVTFSGVHLGVGVAAQPRPYCSARVVVI